MAKNVGKIFESDFKASVPSYSLLIRLNDPPQSFGGGTARFSIKNPCDFLLFDTKRRTLLCCELKTTKYKSISYEDVNGEDNQSRMIHKHQISGLTKFSEYNNVIPCFIFNFRDEANNCERCYFQRIEDFNNMVGKLDKKSCNELDLLSNNAIRIKGEKKKVHYRWDIENLLNELSN